MVPSSPLVFEEKDKLLGVAAAVVGIWSAASLTTERSAFFFFLSKVAERKKSRNLSVTKMRKRIEWEMVSTWNNEYLYFVKNF